MTNDLRLELRAKNNVLWHAIYDVYPSTAEFCRVHGFHHTEIAGLLTLSRNPYKSSGEPRPIAIRLSKVTGISVWELFPPNLYEIGPVKTAAELPSGKFLPLAAAKRLALPAAGDGVIEQQELAEQLEGVLSTLSKREQTVLRARFGLNGGEPLSLEETGKLVGNGVQKERVRQIQQKALRKLRHPTRARRLEAFLGYDRR